MAANVQLEAAAMAAAATTNATPRCRARVAGSSISALSRRYGRISVNGTLFTAAVAAVAGLPDPASVRLTRVLNRHPSPS
jgi:hypothetical protein